MRKLAIFVEGLTEQILDEPGDLERNEPSGIRAEVSSGRPSDGPDDARSWEGDALVDLQVPPAPPVLDRPVEARSVIQDRSRLPETRLEVAARLPVGDGTRQKGQVGEAAVRAATVEIAANPSP